MSRRAATRFAPLSVALAAALALGATACSSEEDSDSASQDGGSESGADTETDAEPEDEGAESDGEADAASGSGEVQQSCGTNDLDFTLTEEADGENLLITATAKSGISCLLESERPSVSFGEEGSADGPAGGAADQPTDTVELSGSTAAYARVNPYFETPYDEDTPGAHHESMLLAVVEGDPNPATLELPRSTEILEPLVTHWHADEADASLAL